VRAVLQRVSRAAVHVGGETISEISRGLLILVGVAQGDTHDDARQLARKAALLRIFEDDAGKMNRSLLDVGGEALVVSQFTLCGDCSKGRRPSFIGAAAPDTGEALYRVFGEELGGLGIAVRWGSFGARMHVEIHNDGPVTFVLDVQHR
jgi:D-tyrosyl-tRNA(Tyr) deacylase